MSRLKPRPFAHIIYGQCDSCKHNSDSGEDCIFLQDDPTGEHTGVLTIDGGNVYCKMYQEKE